MNLSNCSSVFGTRISINGIPIRGDQGEGASKLKKLIDVHGAIQSLSGTFFDHSCKRWCVYGCVKHAQHMMFFQLVTDDRVMLKAFKQSIAATSVMQCGACTSPHEDHDRQLEFAR